MTHGKTYNKSPRRINHKATKSKTNTGTTALERSVEQTTGDFESTGLSAHEKKCKIDFQDGGHLGFPIGTILVTFVFQDAPIFPTKLEPTGLSV